MTAMYFEEKERERERGKYSHKFCPRVAVPSCFRQSYALCFKEGRVALKLLRLEWVRVGCDPLRVQMADAPSSALPSTETYFCRDKVR